VAHEREINRRRQAARFGELAASLAHEIKKTSYGYSGYRRHSDSTAQSE
jgi:hypothetical protein